MIDMHAHLSSNVRQELKARREQKIFTCFSAGTPLEWERYEQVLKTDTDGAGEGGFALSFGIHPWHSDAYEKELRGGLSELSFAECYRKCAFVGEIGMDSVWTKVPLKTQQTVFERQLQIAADLHKPVLLHTKGQETKIAEMICGFPEKVCVHWYSGNEKDLEKYLAADCYFTLGPDTAKLCAQDKDHVRLRMVKEIPLNRLFVETDGVDAVTWAKEQRKDHAGSGSTQSGEKKVLQDQEIDLHEVLAQTVAAVAEIRRISEQAVVEQMRENYREFAGKDAAYSMMERREIC